VNVLLAATIASLCLQGGLQHAREALAAGDYHAAWELGSAEPAVLDRCRSRAEILYRAGDPSAAMREARAGLEVEPGQLELLYYASGAAIWMEDGPSALDYSARFLRAAKTMDEGDSEAKRAWLDAARDFSSRSSDVSERNESLRRAEARLRSVAFVVVALWSLALVLVVRAQGRSSKPVS